MNVLVQGMSLNYTRTGNGPVLVMVHGWGDNLNTFSKLQNMLVKDYEVVSIDMPGFGKSEMPKETFNLEKYAKVLSEFLEKIGVKSILAIIGHSNGGAITIKGVSGGLLNPEKLVLIASSGIRSEYRASKKIARMIVKTAKVPTKILPPSTQKKIRSKVYKTIGSDMLIAEELQDTFKNIVSEDLVLESAMTSQPTLLLYGTEDSATPLRYGEIFLRQIENSRLLKIENAGHFLHQTHTEEIYKAIDEFLKIK